MDYRKITAVQKKALVGVACIAVIFFVFSGSAAAQSVSVTAKVLSSGTCGNGITESGEQCDGSDLNGASCTSQGFTGGTLSCTDSCTFNTSACTSAPAGGGGGGGGGGASAPAPQTAVVFKGKAYPGRDVTLLKDAQVAAVTKAGPDANFEIQLSGLSVGTYTFGVWASDVKGNRSITHTFTITVSSGVTTVVGGIFIPPTITIDKREVRRGDILSILGQTAPHASVNVFINSEEIIKTTSADADGAWLYKFDTAEVDYGDHATRARARKDEDLTTFSQLVQFVVGTKTVQKEQKRQVRGDANGDERVNFVDFSVAAYWYKRSSPPAAIDVNADGAVNLTDFSIMAFYWTG